jgi:hypothetical protein
MAPNPSAGRQPSTGIEAALSLRPRRFFLLDGRWYEIAASYLTGMRARIERLLGGIPSLGLPKWDMGWNERRPMSRCRNFHRRVPLRFLLHIGR